MQCNVRYLLLIPVLLLLCSGCLAPVRTNIFPVREQKDPEEPATVQPPQLRGVETVHATQDTVVLDQTTPLRKQYPASSQEPHAVTGGDNVVLDFEKALELFDREQYSDACGRFIALEGTLPSNDSLRYEVRFMEAECAMVNNQVPRAVQILADLSHDKEIPPTVLERTLIRLGQAYCLTQDFERAALVFRQFKTRYPSSLYIALANCEAAK